LANVLGFKLALLRAGKATRARGSKRASCL